MAKSVSDSDADSKPVSSLFWRSVLNADEPRPSSSSSSSAGLGFRAGAGDHHVKSDDGSSNANSQRHEGRGGGVGDDDEAARFAKRPITTVKQEEYPYSENAGGSYDVRYGRPQHEQQQQQDLPQRHHPLLRPTGPAAALPCATPAAAAAAGARRPIQQYPAEIWETHKAHLHHLYIQQGKSLKQIQQIMAQRGFNASDKMYKDRFSKWGFRKNRRTLTRERAEGTSNSNGSMVQHTNHHYRGSSSGSSVRTTVGGGGMMHAQDCYAQFLETTTAAPPRDYRQQHQQQLLLSHPVSERSLPLAYFQDALYDNRPQLPDTYLVQDQLLRCFDGMTAKAWATGEVRQGDTNKIMYVTPEVHRRLVRLFDVRDYISTVTDETPPCHGAAVMRPGYQSVSNFLRNPSMFGLLRLLQLTMYAGPNTQLPIVWRYIANSPQLRSCSVPGLYELCQNMDRLIGSYPPGSCASSPFVDLVINMLPRLEAMLPPPPPSTPEDNAPPWTPTRKLRDMLRRLLLATSHRQSLSGPLRRYTYNSELLVRELLEVLEREIASRGEPEQRWHVCEDISAALPKEVRLDLAIFHAFKRADVMGNWWQDGEHILNGANIHQSFWELERERGRAGQKPGGYDNNEYSNARLGLAIALRRQAMDFITGTAEQREHGERFEDLKALEAWHREMGDAAAADEAVRQSDYEIERHLATLTL
ncbi:hypothetical protein PG991_012209 [Apiospora marii]|uniref:Clr5 domain-containing protein n=1 Tax=Apiospora marii TaxID=335849 RepID=A0ABR1R9B3_9PEZI